MDTDTSDTKFEIDEAEVFNFLTDALLTDALLPDVDDIVNKWPISAREAYLLRARWMGMALSGLGMVGKNEEVGRCEGMKVRKEPVRCDFCQVLVSSPAPGKRFMVIEGDAEVKCACEVCAARLSRQPFTDVKGGAES